MTLRASRSPRGRVPGPSRARLITLAAKQGTPLLVLDCAVVRSQYSALKNALPGVDLFYALKPMPHAAVAATLRDLGCGFDVATSGEIAVVRSQGVAPVRCIHTHPVKRDSDIRAALRFGIRTFVADNPDEIRKFVPCRRRADLLLRLSFRSPSAGVDLSRKFGCEPAAAVPLVEFARSLGVRVRGLSFHVGSQVADPAKYVEAIYACRAVAAGIEERGIGPLDVLDIGGGFPTSTTFPAPG